MRKYINFIKISLVLIAVGLTGCYEQEVAPIVKPGGLGYTTAVFTTTFDGTEVSEGETITWGIKLSKPLEYDLTFTLKYDGDMSDIEYPEDGVVIPAYTTEGTFEVSFIYDNVPELDKEIKLEVGVFDLGHTYLLTDTKNPDLTLTLKNVNNSDGLTVAVGWADGHDDWDCYLIDEAGAGYAFNGNTYDAVGYAGATGANPEIMIFDAGGLPWAIVDGTYFVDVDPYDVSANPTDFKVSIGHPDQKVQFFDVHFDSAKTDDYPATWGYSVVKIVKAGKLYTCTASPEFVE